MATTEPDDWPGTVDDEWPGTVVRSRGRRGRGKNPASSSATRSPLTGDAVDGDTLKREEGANLRLYGADAPELRQQGWTRDLDPVAIGRVARDAAAGLVDPTGEVGTLRGNSYGRPVAPVMQDGVDVGQQLIRGGNALAADDYLRTDAPRLGDYMEAERLARQNRLGVHGVYAQTPEDYRRAPDKLPDRETVAQFWDTPTPQSGLRPEIERGYLAIQRTGSADDILKYASDNGFTIDPAQTRKFVKSRDARRPVAYEVTYDLAPKPLTDVGDGAVGAAVRGVGDGVLPNLLDEVGALPDALGVTDNRENVWNSDRRWADIYWNNVDQNRAIIGYDDMAHPYARLGGEIAGGLVLPFGAKATTVPQLAKVGGAYGFAAGFGEGETIPDRLIQGTVGLGAGAVGGAAIGKGLQYGLPKLADGWRWARGKGGEPVAVPDAPAGAPDGAGGLPEGVPPPPEGFTPDPMPMATDAGEVATREVRQPDYLDLGQRPRPLLRDATEAERRAATAGIEPGDILPIPSNMVGSVEEAVKKDAGRIVVSNLPDERDALTRRTVRGWNGSEVPKLGPIDLIGFLRLRGGLKDQAGELTHIGMNNAARKMDFAGQEHRFGPLVNDEGANLDDAAFAAWEAGYFPDLSERPDTATFLEALRANYFGQRRNFLPEDMAEVEAHNALRAERQDLEQQRFVEGAPIYTDRSMPADGPAPLPPVEAYQDWPDGGPDFAGNIRLEKLESPQDIKRALSTVNNRVGFDAATRGRVTQAETERLAAELGMTPDTLLSRRKGQALNAEEALAARQILAKSGNELVNLARKVQRLDEPGDDDLAAFRQAWMRHAAIQEQVAGATAEAGRALAQFRMAANSRAVRGDVLAGLVSGGGGRDRIKQAAEVLIEAAETSPGHFNALADKLSKPKWSDKAVELWYNFLLSGPQTHVVNIVSNTLTSLAQLPEHAAAAVIGKGRQIAMRQANDRVLLSEVGARAVGLMQGTREGLREAARTFRTGEPSDFVTKVEAQSQKAISGRKGEILRIPTRALSAEDELFKAMARRMELAGLAVRTASKEGLKGEAAKARIAELTANPTDEMMERAWDYGRYATFQRPLGPIASKVSAFTQAAPLAKLILPFVRTPTNLFKFAVERSPAAPLLREWRKDFAAGGARRDLAIARSMVGTGFGMLVYEMAEKGLITGSPPTDDAKARFMRADGWQPYSVKIGDKFYSYLRLDPFATTIGVAADLATKREGMTERQLENDSMLLVASIMKNMGDKTWLSGFSDFTSAVEDPERYGPAFIKRLAGSMTVPTGVAQVARTIDPVARTGDGVSDAIKARVPGLSGNLPAKRDIWGEAITNEGGVGPDLISPLWQSTAKNDPVNREMQAIGSRMGLPQKDVTIDGEKVRLDARQHSQYTKIAGRGAKAAVRSLMDEPGWKELDPAAKNKAIVKAVNGARKSARDEMFGGKAEEPSSGSDGWLGKPVAGKSDDWPGSPVDQPDVVGDLKRLIPGVGMTSGFRDADYQADMKRRGYSPAENSAHLDGSSLDLTPPPGKSIGWLRYQVKRYRRDAQTLPEGDHLHVTFPDWFAAPVLGGAKAAGLRNPMAGR